jgi:hypothetical protein
MAKSFICRGSAKLNNIRPVTHLRTSGMGAGRREGREQSQKPALPFPLRLLKKLRLKKGRKSTRMLIPKIKISLKNYSSR